ncbi:carbohydrate binding domain-containing protein [Gramella sp. GC03-9]|uniref:Carbohydrate binding domain-containing protein n=1 Tax=Christiangramia oceanisediminis TaxID=2920386 RepID=A0A9X2I8B3_9FLAO|nr:carbohydrate binding domain-containing protein [Gramella oceanisediminis]MCP9199072.1 carbohydrate binding domain-containing protein [Gramella oceanisediminis]
MRIVSLFLAFFALIFATSCSTDDSDIPEVVINSVAPDVIYPGDQVQLQGENFNEVLFVFLDRDQIPFQLDNDIITVTIPTSGGSIGEKTLTLVMPDGYTVTRQMTIVPRPVPIIEALSPSAAQEGEEVRIIGTSLDNLQAAYIGDIEASVVSSTSTELVLTVPSGLQANVPAQIRIVTNGGEATSSGNFYVGDNLLVNGDLESGDGDEFSNWGKWNGGEGLTATTAQGEAYFGRSLRAVAVGGDAWRTQFVSDPVATEIGMEYTLSIWIKAAPGPGNGGNIRFSTNPNALYSGNYNITNEWQQIEWTFTANSEQTRAVLDLGAVANATYYVDNITLVATELGGPQPTDLLLNGGFEEGDGDDFTNWSKLNGADLLTASTDEVRSGSRALRAEAAGGNPWNTQIASDPVPTQNGVEYTASLWIKAGNGVANGGIIRMSTNGNGDAQYQADVTVTNEWQKVEWQITANSSETGIVLDLGTTEGAVYFIDDVSFIEPPQE